MPDIVRLAIVYDTADAMARIAELERRLALLDGGAKRTGSSMHGSSLAAVRLAQSLSQGNVSAVTLTRSLETLGGPTLGNFAIGLGVVVGAGALWLRHLDNVKKETAAFSKEIDTATDSVNKLLGIKLNDTEEAIHRLQTRIKELQDQVANPSWWDRFKGWALKLLPDFFLKEFQIPSTVAAPPAAAAAAQLLRLQRALEASQRNLGYSGPPGNALPGGGLTGTEQVIPLSMRGVGGERGPAPERILNLKYWEDQARAEEKVRREAQLLSDGLWTTADAIEHFMLTGTLAFQDFLNNILSMLFRAAAQDVINDILGAAFHGKATSGGIGTYQEGGIVPGTGPQFAVVHGGEEIIPAGRGPSVATSVTFNVTAMDSQDVARLFDRHGGLLAATLAREADRSHALRRRLAR